MRALGTGFNPRARMGRDFIMIDRVMEPSPGFNPRARMGRDNVALRTFADLIKFQSTRPHGARLTHDVINIALIGFNPRARMGRDLGEGLGKTMAVVSIHAPAWGATFGTVLIFYSVCVSIHAPAWGATLFAHELMEIIPEFQSTRPHGARLRFLA